MFERFTERVRQVIVIAQQEARDAKSDRIDSVAMLLGLIGEGEGLASRLLTSLNVDAAGVRKHWRAEGRNEAIATGEERASSAKLPFTADAKTLLEYALREALSFGHNYIGTEHVLLGLVRRVDSDAAMILHDYFGVNGDAVRREVCRLLSPPKVRAKTAVEELERENAKLRFAVHVLLDSLPKRWLKTAQALVELSALVESER